MAEPSLIVESAARPYPGEEVSGDAWTAEWHDGACRVALIDGLGHGPEAARAARAAVAALEARPELPPEQALRLCDQALRGTRGAAISVARIDPDGARLVYAGIGNVEARLWHPDTQERLVTYRGIVGTGLAKVRAFELALRPGWLLLMHTDGISARFERADLAAPLTEDPRALAETLLRRWGRARDDATVTVVCPRPDLGAGVG